MLKRRNNFQEGGVVQRAYEEYQRRVGQPFQQTVRGGVRGYFGLPLMSDADETGREAYRQAEAIGSIPGVSAPAKIARGAAEIAQTAPTLAAGALGLVKRTKKETPISFKADESLLATAQKDVEKAGEKYLFIDDMQRDAQGVIPKKLKNLDRGLTKGDYTEQQIKEAFSDTRKALKEKYGDKLVLYRADAPKEERLADAKTVYMGDESLAKRFEQQGRKAQPYTVDVDDVLGVYTTRSGYYEVIVKKEALEKAAKAKEPKMAKGGMMARNIPGFQEGGTNVDPVSGNEVPTGSLPEEVRDDVDAKLSPGEFVIPADVVRFIGLERLMKMRDEAKKGLERMAAIGQMGNAEEVGEESNSTYEDEGFESEIDDILEEIEAEENDKGDAGEQTEKMMAVGGFIGSGTDITKAPKNPMFDVRYYKNDQGTVMYITHINGKPMSPVPEGFKLVTKEEAQKVGLAAEEAKKAEQKPAAGAGTVTGQEGPGMGLEDTSAANVAALQAGSTSGLQTGTTVPTGAIQAAGAVGAMLGIPGATALMTKGQQIAAALTNMSGVQAGKANIENMGKAFGLDTSTTEGQAAASSLIDSLSSTLGGPAATSGPSGTGGAAASAASSAGTAAAAAGHSQGAIGAAAQAAANAVIGGATPAEAAQAGADAAAAAEASGEGAAVGVGGSVSDGPGSGGGPDDGSFAKGGLVNRRQYPAKKKRGKGIIAQK